MKWLRDLNPDLEEEFVVRVSDYTTLKLTARATWRTQINRDISDDDRSINSPERLLTEEEEDEFINTVCLTWSKHSNTSPDSLDRCSDFEVKVQMNSSHVFL